LLLFPKVAAAEEEDEGSVVFFNNEACDGDGDDPDHWKTRGNVPVSPAEKGYATEVGVSLLLLFFFFSSPRHLRARGPI